MGNIYVLTIIAMMITLSMSFSDSQRYPEQLPGYMDDRYDPFNVLPAVSDPQRYPERLPGYMDDRYDPFNALPAVCGDGRRCSSDIDVNDIDRAKLLSVVSDLLQDEGYQPFTTLYVFKGKKKHQVKWKPWLLLSQAVGHVEYRRK